MKRLAHILSVILAMTALSGWAAEGENQNLTNSVLQDILKVLPRSEPWEKWLKEKGEQPPDFIHLPRHAELPDPLRFQDGREVRSVGQWQQRRKELLELFQYYAVGRVPPPPGNVRAGRVQSRMEGNLRIQGITLEFGPEHKAKLNMEMIVPPGQGPFPVFMTQDNHRGWALVAVSRGYIGCVYAGADSFDDTGAFTEIWKDYDWSKLTRRAWAASRCLDYLLQLPLVDRSRVALAGHSRNGKTSLIAAALDDRFTAVISSSSGAGGACPYRCFSETQFGEGIELITRTFPDWFHPRLRFFAGRESQLPIDQHELVACIAPRACLISTALNDNVESVWAVEQTYYAAQRVYSFLGAAPAINLRYRQGGHPTKAEDAEAFMDWLDTRLGRRAFPVGNAPIVPTYGDWQRINNEKIVPSQFPVASMAGLLTTASGNVLSTDEQWKEKQNDIRQRIQWVLGDPPVAALNHGMEYGAEPGPVANLMGRSGSASGVEKMSLNFANFTSCDLYYPTGATNSGRYPAIIWLHPLSFSCGYSPAYRRGEPPYLAMVRAGFVVLAFDQIGHGTRIEEAQRFYLRYPRWSLMGRMVRDAQSAVDVLARLSFVDARKIYALGYATGGMTALHAAALDERIAGVISVAGFTPMRLDTAEKRTGGVARWAQWLPLMPRLGAFVGNEERIPYDYHEVLALIAPRPVLLVAPRIDYQATPADVIQCVEEASRVYEFKKAEDRLSLMDVPDYNHFSPEMQMETLARFKAMVGL